MGQRLISEGEVHRKRRAQKEPGASQVLSTAQALFNKRAQEKAMARLVEAGQKGKARGQPRRKAGE